MLEIRVKCSEDSLPYLLDALRHAKSRALRDSPRVESDGVRYHMITVESWHGFDLFNALVDRGVPIQREGYIFFGATAPKFGGVKVFDSNGAAHDVLAISVDGMTSKEMFDILRELFKGVEFSMHDESTIYVHEPEDVNLELMRNELKQCGCKFRKNRNKPGYKIKVV